MAITRTSWVKGQSGNYAGRPRKYRSTAKWFYARMAVSDNHRRQKRVVSKLIDKAISGDWQAIKLIMLYTDGKPRRNN